MSVGVRIPMTYLLLLVLLPSTLAEDLCTDITDVATDLPVLPKVFHTVVDGTFSTATGSRKVEMELYYDFDKKQGAKFIYDNGELTRYIFDLDNQKTYKITGGTCVEDTNSITFFEFPYDMSSDIGPSHVFYFGDPIVEQKGTATEIRGIGVDTYNACLKKQDDADFLVKLDYYFKSPDMPVRAVVQRMVPDPSNATQNVKETYTYDFIAFHTGRPCDTSVFEFPRGVLCPLLPSEVPGLMENFMLTTELVYLDENSVFVVKEFHDTNLLLSRYDWTPQQGHSTGYENFGNQAMTVFHDFNPSTSMLEYVILQNGTCHVRPIAEDILEGSWNDVNPAFNSSMSMTMRRGQQFFGIDGDLSYQGKKMFRSIQTDVWGVVREQTVKFEYYFGRNDWQVLSHGGVTSKPLLGIWMRKDDGTSVTESISHIVDYGNGDTLFPSPYDISGCFSEGHIAQFYLLVTGSYGKLSTSQTRAHLTSVVRRILGNTAGVSPLQISGVEFFPAETNRVEISMTLLDAPVLADGEVLPPHVILVELDTAWQRIVDASNSNNGISFTFVSNTETITWKVIPQSVTRTMTSSPQPQPQPQGGGHSNGSMAALGFFMIILGTVLGLGVGFVLWRRGKRGVPYTVQP